jgi:dTDP-4-amino-4,6-dideoxygalactose transaminase
MIRFAYRLVVTEKRRIGKKAATALIVGAGEMGWTTAGIVEASISFRLAALIDVKKEVVGKMMNGVPVYGLDELEKVIDLYDIKCVFLAEPDLTENDSEIIKQFCEKNKIELKDYTSYFDFAGESDSFVGMQDVVKGPVGEKSIPFSPPDISEREIEEVVETLNSGWITTGPRTKLLERRLAAYIETGRTDIDCTSKESIEHYSNRVVCLNSATASEELNLRVLGIGPSDEVIVPAYTYTASASAAIHCGAKVIFVDIQKDGDPVTHMPEMDYHALEEAITPETKAIITVDLGGIVCDYERIFEIVERKKSLFKPVESDGTPLSDLSSRIQKAIGRVAVVADCAHSLGASRVIKGERRYCGAIADFTSYSFHAVKNFTTAEGGAATWLSIQGIDNAEIYKMYQLLSLHGQNKDALAKTKVGAWEYDIIGPWYKCNMTDIMAAIGLRQLDRYLGLLERRTEMMKKYDAVCAELQISHMIHHTGNMDSSNHLYLIRVPEIDVETRNLIIEKMAERGVATNVHYKPLPMMTAYGKDCSAYPNSYDYYHNLITLPFHTLLSDEDVEYICETLKEVYTNCVVKT